MKKIKVKSKIRWKVLQNDGDFWTVGLYLPENRTKDEIKFLEKHNCKEIFLLLEGEATLVVKKSKNSREYEIPLKKDEMVVVDEYHNAYSLGGAKILVIERGKAKTEFIKR